MPSGAQSRSALAALGHSLPRFRDGSRVTLELAEMEHQGIIELARPQAGARLDAVLAAFHASELPRVGASLRTEHSGLLGTGPGRWMLIAAQQSLGLELGDAFGVAVEAGDAWTQFAISGSAARDLLAKGCALDLHPGVFAEGACAVTRFAQLRCVLHRLGAGYRLLVGRSYAVSLAEWLNEAAAEFGLASQAELSVEAMS